MEPFQAEKAQLQEKHWLIRNQIELLPRIVRKFVKVKKYLQAWQFKSHLFRILSPNYNVQMSIQKTQTPEYVFI